MTRDEVKQAYKVDEHGIIRSPGQHEGNPVYVPALWSVVMDGSSNPVCDEFGEILREEVDILEEDIAEFPELAGCKVAELKQSDNGFIYCSVE